MSWRHAVVSMGLGVLSAGAHFSADIVLHVLLALLSQILGARADSRLGRSCLPLIGPA